MNSTSHLTISNQFKIPLFCILVLEMSVGFLSCTSVIWIYWKKRHIRTAANLFITHLAVVDALICVFGISFTTARLGTFSLRHSELFCLSHEGITSALRNASVGTLLLICFDRYKSITNPFRLRINFTKAKRALFFLWLFAGISCTLPFIEYGIKKDRIHASQSCVEYFSKTPSSYKIRFYYFPVFLIATIITLPCYWKISKAALSRIHIQSIVVKTSLVIPMGPHLDRRRETAQLRQKEWKVAKMTGAIMCSVCILWLPYTIFTFILNFCTPNSTLAKLEYTFLVLGYLNCTLNPLLYAFTKQKFRNAFLRTLPKFGKEN